MLLFHVLQCTAIAQPAAAPVFFPLSNENVSLAGFSDYTLTYKEVKDIDEISVYSFHRLQNDTAAAWSPPQSVESIWIRFAISNKLLADTFLVLKAVPAARMILFEQVNGKFTERGRSGKTVPVTQLSMPDDDKRIRIPVKAGQIQRFLLRQQRSSGIRFTVPVLQSEGQAALERRHYEQTVIFPKRYFFILLAGFHLAVFFFSFIKYYSQKKDRAYLFYSLFNGFTFLLYLVETNILGLESTLWNNLENSKEGSFVVNVINSLFYVAFQIELLQLHVNKPVIVRWVKVYAGVLLFGLLLTLLANQLRIFSFVGEYTLLLFQSGYILGACVLVHLTRKKGGFYKYVFYATVSLLIGCLAFVIAVWSGLSAHLPAWFSVDFLLAVPVALEVLFFLMALVYRDKQVEVEKMQIQQQLIEQLEKNKRLQDNFTQNLTQQVKEKTEELIAQRSVLEKEREAKLVAEFERKFSESELKALRSQINPHFIFNVLNTIESYTLVNNREAASLMIQKFSKLTRLVLENSLQQLVPFEQDFQALQLYVELEQMRYEEKFRVHYIIDENLSEGNYPIPPMIIQPYVENAILHGLRNLSSGDGLLTIRGYLNGECIAVTIEDNGIGRKRSALLKRNNPIAKSSVGMKVTHDRIAVFNSLVKGNKARVEIEDLERGTRVKLLLPLFYQ